MDNDIKRFRKTGKNSVRKGQGRRPFLDARAFGPSDDTASFICMILFYDCRVCLFVCAVVLLSLFVPNSYYNNISGVQNILR